MLVYCMLVCTGWVPQMNFVAACQLDVLLPRASLESLGGNSYPYSLGCARVPR